MPPSSLTLIDDPGYLLSVLLEDDLYLLQIFERIRRKIPRVGRALDLGDVVLAANWLWTIHNDLALLAAAWESAHDIEGEATRAEGSGAR